MSEFTAALAALRADLPPITKRTRGQHGKYADYRSIKAKVDPVLARHGFVWSTTPGLAEVNGETRFVLSYSLTHLASGEFVVGLFPLQEMDPQRQGSQISYAKRYALCAVLDLAPEGEDDDGMAASQLPEGRTKATIPGPEHERLRHGTVERTPDDQVAERGPAEVDPWRDQPPGQLPHTPELSTRRGSLDSKQKKRIMARLGGMTHDNRVARLRRLTGDESIGSTDHLSAFQADDVIRQLEGS